MAESIFCLEDEKRQRLYNELSGINEIRLMLTRKGLKWEPYERELRTCIHNITRLLDELPLDPRCQ